MTDNIQKGGKAFLVGAGPGDPGLITLRGKECLERADVVLYDNLANPSLLRYAHPNAERIYVGRRGRGGYLQQGDINNLIIRKVREGHRVVRLKGGDPFVFGRGGEEAEVVAEAGLPFEIVPGVTSAVAVPAYAGIPVTHRTMASTAAFVTGHEDLSKEDTALEWPRLASADGTLVFLMGMKNLPLIVEKLLALQKSPDTPVALVRWGTYTRQRTITGTLSTIVEQAEAAHMEPPTIIVVGSVVGLRERLNWFETRPLFGKRILVTRPSNQAGGLSELLTEMGGEPVECPTLHIEPPENWKALDEAIGHLSQYEWLVFTSVNGVRWFMVRLQEQRLDSRALHGVRIACIGPRTAQALEPFGLRADVVPSQFQAEGLIEVLAGVGIAGHRILIPRAAQAREILPQQLTAMGAQVHVVTAYRAVMPDLDAASLKEDLRKGDIHILTFASSSTVRNFCGLFASREELKMLTKGVIIACIGPITSKTVQDYGLSTDVLAKENTIPAMVESLITFIQHTGRSHA